MTPPAPLQSPPHLFLHHCPFLLPASTRRSSGRSRGVGDAAEAGPRPHLPRPQLGSALPPSKPSGSSPRSPRGRRAPHRRRRLAGFSPPSRSSPGLPAAPEPQPVPPPPVQSFPFAFVLPLLGPAPSPPSGADALRGRPSTSHHHPSPGRARAAPPAPTAQAPPPSRQGIRSRRTPVSFAATAHVRSRSAPGVSLEPHPPQSPALAGEGSEWTVPTPTPVRRPEGPGAMCPGRTCPLGPAPESSLSRRPASRPVLVPWSSSRCPRFCLSFFLSFALCLGLYLCPSTSLYRRLPVSLPPSLSCTPNRPGNPGVSPLSLPHL